MVGTTQFVNAMVERRRLAPTGLIRLCLPSGGSIKPFADWPADLMTALHLRYRLADGGCEMDGRELAPIIELIGQWGTRWVPELGDEDLDPHLLMWDMHRRIDLDAVPDGRTTLLFSFADVATSDRDWWLVIGRDGVDVCDFDPGYDVRATIRTTLRSMIEVWRGDLGWGHALRSGELAVDGDETARRALPRWLMLSVFATVPRPDRGQRLPESSVPA
jgi:hypothetical protein